MWIETDLQEYKNVLMKNDRDDVAHWLSLVYRSQIPTGKTEIIDQLLNLIDDRRGYMITWAKPSYWGEIRWLATHVLACEYAYIDFSWKYTLKDVVKPIITETEIFELIYLHGLSPGSQKTEHLLDQLIEKKLAPTYTITVDTKNYANCSKDAVEQRIKERWGEDTK